VQHCVEGSHRFTVLADLDAEMDINSDWEASRENIKFIAKKKCRLL
jgi:hypothetical protein